METWSRKECIQKRMRRCGDVCSFVDAIKLHTLLQKTPDLVHLVCIFYVYLYSWLTRLFVFLHFFTVSQYKFSCVLFFVKSRKKFAFMDHVLFKHVKIYGFTQRKQWWKQCDGNHDDVGDVKGHKSNFSTRHTLSPPEHLETYVAKMFVFMVLW